MPFGGFSVFTSDVRRHVGAIDFRFNKVAYYAVANEFKRGSVIVAERYERQFRARYVRLFGGEFQLFDNDFQIIGQVARAAFYVSFDFVRARKPVFFVRARNAERNRPYGCVAVEKVAFEKAVKLYGVSARILAEKRFEFKRFFGRERFVIAYAAYFYTVSERTRS